MPLQMKVAAPMQGNSALTPGKPGPWRSEKIGIASSTSAIPRATCRASALRKLGKPSTATMPPIKNSHARGGLMKKAAAERSVFISHMHSAKEATLSPISATGNRSRPLRP
jgi:hypothetical protein